MNTLEEIAAWIETAAGRISASGHDAWMSISLPALVQTAILYFAIYAILKRSRGSHFGQALLGVGLVAAILAAVSLVLDLDVITQIVKVLLYYLAISTVVIFQPEIRHFLIAVGAFGFIDRPKNNPDGSASVETVCDTIEKLAKMRMGALIAFERGISLRSIEESGVKLDAAFSPELVQTIFTPPLPLHDGGMVIRNGRISSAHDLFPLSSNPNLSASGTRHRAAVGLSEETDAYIVVVSEERGSVSIAHNGRLTRYGGNEIAVQLPRWIEKALPGGGDNYTLQALVSKFVRRVTDRFRAKKGGEQ